MLSPLRRRPSTPPAVPLGTPGEISTGTLWTLKNGYGFIAPEKGGPNMFFFHGDVVEVDFLDLRLGEKVQFVIGQNDRGLCAKEVRPLRPAPVVLDHQVKPSPVLP